MSDVFGSAILDYLDNKHSQDIITYSSLGEKDLIAVSYLFRTYDEMPILEQRALQLCTGKVLDIGCGAGSHSLYLQSQGYDVVGLDLSAGAIKACQLRGLEQTIKSSILSYSGTKFDTLLLLMNGIGIVGKLKTLPNYLNHFKSLLNPNGQIVLDSSDIIYMFQENDDGSYWVDGQQDYYGEVEFRMTYKKLEGRVFPWLYVDYNTLSKISENNGFACELVSNGEHYDYLARLTLKP